MRETFGRLLGCIVLILIPFASIAREISLSGFGEDLFHETIGRNQPGGFHMVEDPLNNSGGKKIFEFSVVPGPCFEDDCESNSARSTLQQGKAKQPKEAWYGWDMYFPPDFAYGPKQVSGFNIYNEWKDQDNCMLVGLTNFGGWTAPQSGQPDMNLSWRMQNSQLAGDCPIVLQKPIASFDELLGKWNRFEAFIRWSKKKDGKVQIYLDGNLKLDYDGVTCFANCNKKMYYLFGHYICCTEDTESIVASKVYYKNISRSEERSGLQWKD